MKIGIISDTHGSVERTNYAITKLLEENVAHIIHCGDVGSEEVLVEAATLLHERGLKMDAALGNVDIHNTSVENFPESSGINIKRDHRLSLAGKNILVIHGDDMLALRLAAEDENLDYIFTGHTHEAADQHFGSVRVINPGAVYRAAEPSFATLDLESDALKYFHIN